MLRIVTPTDTCVMNSSLVFFVAKIIFFFLNRFGKSGESSNEKFLQKFKLKKF